MANLKIGNKNAIRNAAKKSGHIHKPPVSNRISNFLIEEGKRERELFENQKKRIATPKSNDDLEA